MHQKLSFTALLLRLKLSKKNFGNLAQEILVIIVIVVSVPLEKVHLWVMNIVIQQLRKNKIHTEQEIKIEMILPSYLQKDVLNTLFIEHPYEEVAFELQNIDNINPWFRIIWPTN